MNSPRLFTLILLVGLLTPGCASHRWDSSRWALTDPEYAEKYDEPYEPGEIRQMARKVKQASDARFMDDRGGFVVGIGGSGDPTAISGEIGIEGYFTSYITGKATLQGLLAEGAEVAAGGVNLALRVQSPTRFAPFAGVGTFIGGGSREECGCNNGLDDDDDGWIDEPGEIREVNHGLFAIYPEVGAHFWLSPNVRLTGSGAYYITNEGRDYDFWLVGLTLGFFTDDGGKFTVSKER